MLHPWRLVPLAACLFGIACSPPVGPDAGTDASSDVMDVMAGDVTDAITDAGVDAQPITATTNSGPVVGRDFGAYQSFLGIPYAASPSAALRWRPPVAMMVTPWAILISAAAPVSVFLALEQFYNVRVVLKG